IVIAGLAPLDEDVPGDAPIDALRASVAAANEQLRRTVADNPELDGMGTTLTALLFSGSRAAMVHIGDSRAYLLRDGEFTQITRDDTYVQKLVDEGRISPEEAGSHPQRSLLTRAIDGTDIEPEYSVRQVLPGDRYLLCSDGLSGVVSAETIAQTLRDGGPDNVALSVAAATDEDSVEAPSIVGGAAARDMQPQAARESTPARRASALTPPRPPVPAADDEDPDDEPAPPRHPVRHALLLLTLVGLLGGGLWYGWNATQSSYYVGATESGRVAVFQGLPGRVAGIELSRVYATSEVSVSDLTELAQERVLGGDIRRGSAEEARQTMAE